MTAVVLRGDAAYLPLPDASVDLIVTSPPYYALRSYTDGGEHYAGQIGSEATPAEYIAALAGCTREWIRVLKPSGSLFVNLGDKYSSGNGGASNVTALGQRLGTGGGQKSDKAKQRQPPVPGMRPKCLLGLPWRYALACTDQLGLILRAEIIWAKPNGLPESVTDRVRRSHEQWFHFTRQPRYYSAVDEIREPTTREGWTWAERKIIGRTPNPDAGHNYGGPGMAANPLGKLPGSVWTIPSQPLTVPPGLGVDHFAAFPMELPRRIILGWSPPGICTACGEGRRPVAEFTQAYAEHRGPGTHWNRHLRAASGYDGTGDRRAGTRPLSASRLIGSYACACPTPDAPARPAVVLDPFGGTGTTALLAHVLGRTGISVDRSADYSRIAAWRTTDPGQRAAALQVDKPPQEVTGQAELFEAG